MKFPLALLFPLLFASISHANPRSAALWQLKNEQIALFEEIKLKSPYYAADAQKWLDITREMKRQIETKNADFFVSPLSQNLLERAYFADNDGSAQPYFVALPTGYTPRKKWPLAIFLHGYASGITKISPWLPSDDTIRAAQNRGFILAIPYGRRNSDFVQWGQDDLLAVQSEIERIYSVDTTRISLLGASMGGFGTLAAGLHLGGNFAALAPISARTDMFLWFKTAPEKLPAWKQILYRSDDPRTLAPNARTTPIFLQHGALDDIVPIEHARRFAADAQKLQLPFKFHEEPRGDHWADFQIPAYERAFDWLKTQKYEPPRKFSVVAGDLREARGHFAQIEAFENYDQLARLDVDVSVLRGKNAKIAVQTQNVAAFSLEIPREWARDAGLVPLEINGQRAPISDARLPIRWQNPDAKRQKSPQRSGPFKSLLRDRFLLVYGDGNDKIAAQKFALEWRECADGDAPLKSAAQIVASDKSNFHLILFGTRETNSLLREIADELPLELTKNGFRRGETLVAGQNLGLRMVWKSPWNAQKMLGVCSGRNWGEALPVNHKWDLLPDFCVYGDKKEEDGTNAALFAGFFDGNWEF